MRKLIRALITSARNSPKVKPVIPFGQLSKQRQWQLRMIAEGKCGGCGKPRENYQQKCDDCTIKLRQHARRRAGCQPWEEGSRGRRPKVREGE